MAESVIKIEDATPINVYTDTGNFAVSHNSSFKCSRYVHIEFDGILSGQISESNIIAEIRTHLPPNTIRGFVYIGSNINKGGMDAALNSSGTIRQLLASSTPSSGSIYFKFDYCI